MNTSQRNQSVKTHRRWSCVAGCWVTVGLFMLPGCVERTISISSDPSGALVYLNDEEVGRTPCETQFVYYGEYDVRLVLDGYDPYIGSAMANTPLYDQPVLDLVSEMMPFRYHSLIEWHFELEPAENDRASMIERANELRGEFEGALGGE